MFKEESIPMLLEPFQKAGGRNSSLNSCSQSRISNCGNLGENCIAKETAILVCPILWPFDSESLPHKSQWAFHPTERAAGPVGRAPSTALLSGGTSRDRQHPRRQGQELSKQGTSSPAREGVFTVFA